MRITTLLALCFALCSGWAAAVTQAKQPSTPEQFKSEFANLLDEQKVVGAQLVIFDGEGTQVEYYHGLSSKTPEVKVDENTLFRAGSTTKPFVALAIMQLIAQGYFDLQTKLSDFAPEIAIKNRWQDTHPVRVVHLLEHTAGFDDMHFKNMYNLSGQQLSLLESINRDSSALYVRWQPGTRHSYANPGYGILGYLIEKVTQQPFSEYISQNILMPLDIQNTQFGYKANANQQLSQGFNNEEAVPNHGIYLRSAGNLTIPAIELAKFGRYLLNTEKHNDIAFISSKTLAQMEQPQSTLAAQHGLNFGYGLGLYQSDRDGNLWIGHNGGVGEFITAFAYSRELNIGYVLMVNTSSIDYRAISKMLMAYLHQTSTKHASVSTVKINNDIEGYYRQHSDRNQILAGITWPFNVVNVSQQDETLSVTPLLPADSLNLLHLGDNQFAEKGSSIANSIFIEHSQYGKVLVTDGQFWVETSLLSAWIPLILSILFALSLAVTVLYLPVWLFNAFRGKLSKKGLVAMRAMPFAALASLVMVLIAITQITWLNIADKNFANTTIYVCTWLFAVFSIASVWTTYKYKKQESSKFARVFMPLSSALFMLSTIYFATNNYIGLALWAW